MLQWNKAEELQRIGYNHMLPKVLQWNVDKV